MRTYKEVREALKKIGHLAHSGYEGLFLRDLPFVHQGDTFTDADLLADTSFLDAWTRPQEILRANATELKKLFPKVNPVLQYLAKETIFADPLHKGREWVTEVEPGLYRRLDLLKAVRSFIKGKKKPDLSKFDFAPYLHTDPLVYLSYQKRNNREGANLHLMGGLDGSITTVLDYEHEGAPKWKTLPGLMMNKWYGKPGEPITSEQYLKLLPALYTGMSRFGFIYTTCVWDESLAAEWDRAPAILENFQGMLKLLPQVTCYAAIPTRLRYTGFGRESQGGVLRRIEEPYSLTDNTLLYDGPAWILLLAINGKPVQGRVAVTEEGRFIVSEWCFRETPRQNERYEMFSGAFVKHTLLTWCAGPLLDRFGGSIAEHVAPGGVDGRVPDTTKNIFRMQTMTKIDTMKGIAKEIIKGIVKDAKPIDWQDLHKKGIEYPIGAYIPCDDYVVYCTKPIIASYSPQLQGLKVSHLYIMARDITYTYEEQGGYVAYVNSSYHRETPLPLPASLVAALFNIEPPKREPQEIPEPPKEVVMEKSMGEEQAMDDAIASVQEIPTPGAEPTFVTPMAPPVLPAPQEPESVPPLPAEVS